LTCCREQAEARIAELTGKLNELSAQFKTVAADNANLGLKLSEMSAVNDQTKLDQLVADQNCLKIERDAMSKGFFSYIQRI
jgi:hypothetical protein